MPTLSVPALVSLLIWIYLLTCHGSFWRTDVRLPRRHPPATWPSVAVVVPARDEADVLPESLPTLLNQRYSGRIRVVLVDDNSSDGTTDTARSIAGASSGGVCLSVTSPGTPPPGWAGKMWALRHGVAFATECDEPDYFLFTDADIAHGPESVARLVGSAGDRAIVSLMARLRARSGWERVIVPAFVYFFAQLYPFRRVARPRGRTAAAAGGCVLIRRDALVAAGGVERIRDAVIDDVALARAVKSTGASIWLGLADDVRSVRPYPRLRDLWRMIARSAYTQLRYSPVLLVATVLGLLLVYIVPPLALMLGLAAGIVPLWSAGLAGYALMCASFVPMVRYYQLPVGYAATLPVAALLYLAMTVDSAIAHWRGRGATWKGRVHVRSSK